MTQNFFSSAVPLARNQTAPRIGPRPLKHLKLKTRAGHRMAAFGSAKGYDTARDDDVHRTSPWAKKVWQRGGLQNRTGRGLAFGTGFLTIKFDD